MSDESTNFLRLEVPGFGYDEYEEPMTSTLRLGAVGMTPTQLPELLLDPGEDLTRRVSGFFDDTRARCDPPELDGGFAADAPQSPVGAAELMRLKLELDQAREHARQLRESLEAILPDPFAWVDNLMRNRAEAVERLNIEQAKLDAALEEAAEAQRTEAETDQRIPPSHCAPGWIDPDDVPLPDPDEVDTEGVEDGEEVPLPEAPPYTRYVHKVDRRQQSARLHKMGGWRDHTDGNRITTTRGDKVEVVGGNYRLVVLGRTDDPTDADGNPVLPGWEISGGHLEQTDATRVVPETSLSWRRRWNGNWYSYEEHLKGDTAMISSGDTEEESYGHRLETVVGTETPDGPWHEPEDCPGGRCHTNPKIIDHTWAELMDTTTGSPKWPVPELRDRSWMTRMSTETHAETLSDRRDAKTLTTTTVAGSIEDETRCETMVTSTVAGTITDHTTVGVRTTTTLSALMLTANFGRTANDVFGASADLFVGVRNTVSIAAALDLTAASQLSVFVGLQADLNLTASLSISMEGKEEINVGPKVTNNLGPIVKVAPVISMNGVHIDVG